MTHANCRILIVLAGLLLGGCAEPIAEFPDSHREPSFSATTTSESEPVTSSAPALGPDATLQDYLEYAAINNPGLEAAFNRWKAAVERVPQMKSLPDPMVGYMYMTKPRAMRQRQAVEFSQTLPWFGKLDLQGQAAFAAAEAGRHRYEAARLKLFYDVKMAYYEYYYLGRAIDTVRDNVELVKQLERVVRIRYSVGTASHPDTIRVQVELARLENRLRELQDLRLPVMARLNVALGRGAAEELPVPASIQTGQMDISDAELESRLMRNSPDLLAAQAEIEMSRREMDLARKEYYPDVTFGLQIAEAMAMDMQPREDVYTASVAINLPIWREKLGAGVDESHARIRMAAAEKIDRVNMLIYDLKMAAFGYRDAVRRLELYENTLLPKARESLNVTLKAYQAGESGFTDLIEAERMLLEFQLDQERARTDAAATQAEVEMLVGEEM
jgi:cobalt-zinc-cadmium efflux system outer membrane protein